MLLNQFLHNPAGFFDGGGDIVRRDDGGAVHAIRSHFAKVVHPVVVGFSDGGSELRIQAVDGENEQSAAGIKYRDIESLFIHGPELRNVIEATGFFFGVLFFEDSLANRSKGRTRCFQRARDDLSVDFNTEISFVA